MTETSETLSTAGSGEVIPAADIRSRLLIWARSKDAIRFAKFFAVGIIGAVIDFTTFTLLKGFKPLGTVNISLFGMFTITRLGVAGTCGFLLAIISNFFWNRYWVYPDSRSKSVIGQIMTFLIVSIAGILIRLPIVELLTIPLERLEHTILPALTQNIIQSFGETSSWALSVIAVMFWNFFVNRYWTFNDVK